MGLRKLKPLSGWMSVKDRLPEENKHVLCYFKAIDCCFVGSIRLGRWTGTNLCFKDLSISELTHWQPLPDLPEEYKED